MRWSPLLLALACGGPEPAIPTGTGTPPPEDTGTTIAFQPTHDVDVQPIWVATCGETCHIDDDDGGLELGLDAFGAIVGVPSLDVPTMALVTPGSLDESYLWHKINGTWLDVGGDGQPMPRGGDVLESRDKKIVRAWIEGGAPR